MQSTSTILMIRPACFFYNEETGKSNSFQNKVNLDSYRLTELAQNEFDVFVSVLRDNGVEVLVIEDSLIPAKPDAVFPNNWISFHENGMVLTYPMESINRRSERRLEIIQAVSQRFVMKELIDFAKFEFESKYLEGTGSMVLDRNQKTAYACLSPRTSVEVLEQFSLKLNYDSVLFHAVDEAGIAIYHTNVMMSIGENFVLICLDAIKDISERHTLISSFTKNNKEIIEISLSQVNAFAGNLLQLKSKNGKDLIILSSAAYKAMDKKQLDKLRKHGELVPISIPTIEKVGGGSVRCMMAEVFLPSKRLRLEI